MKFRWTIKELKESTDAFILRGILNERLSDLNSHCPLSVRLTKIRNKYDRLVQEEQL